MLKSSLRRVLYLDQHAKVEIVTENSYNKGLEELKRGETMSTPKRSKSRISSVKITKTFEIVRDFETHERKYVADFICKHYKNDISIEVETTVYSRKSSMDSFGISSYSEERFEVSNDNQEKHTYLAGRKVTMSYNRGNISISMNVR